MFGITIPWAIETARCNPVRETVRNLMIQQGDDVTFAIQAYGYQGAVQDISGAQIAITVTHDPDFTSCRGWYGSDGYPSDYGASWWTYPYRVLWQGIGTIIDGASGQATAVLPQSVTKCWRGRYMLLITLGDQYGGGVRSRGALEVMPGALVSLPAAPGVVSVENATLTGDFSPSDFGSQFSGGAS